jgi:hypothetical protein
LGLCRRSAGAANSRHEIDICVTNKFWEYIAAGIPVVTFNAKEMASFYEVWPIDELDTLNDPPCQEETVTVFELQRRCDTTELRSKFTMETQTPAILQAYKEAIK